jgi:transposase-like protein
MNRIINPPAGATESPDCRETEKARRPRRSHGAEFKAGVALATIHGEKSLSELAEQFDVHPHLITEWK